MTTIRPITDTDNDDTTLRAIGIGFVQTPTATMLLVAVLTAMIWRASTGPAHWSDVAVIAALAVLRPFAEWTMHKLLLHGQPRRWRGLRFDPLAARAHHAAPRDPRHVLTPPLVIVELIAAAWLGTAWLPEPLDATAAATVLTFALTTEWMHALIHSQYQPRSAWLHRLARRHRLHHHRNERYWFGVSSTTADRILGTAPEPAATPISSTTRSVAGCAQATDSRPEPPWSAARSAAARGGLLFQQGGPAGQGRGGTEPDRSADRPGCRGGNSGRGPRPADSFHETCLSRRWQAMSPPETGGLIVVAPSGFEPPLPP